MGRRRLLTSGELADELGLSQRSISRYVQRGWLVLMLTTPGGRYRWDHAEVREKLRRVAKSRKT
jgi:DNA-binding transcriptional MerR regulator